MSPERLGCPFAALEKPENAFVPDVSAPLEEMIDKIVETHFSS
jgi:hypothetical protein